MYKRFLWGVFPTIISYMCDVDILVTTFAFTTFWSLRHLPKRNFDKRLKKIHTKNKNKKINI